MPVTYRIDTTKSVIYTTCSGDVTLDEVLGHFQILMRDPLCPDQLDVLLDLGELTSVPESHQLREVSDQIGRIRHTVRFGACAIVASRDVIFGMARMFEVLAEQWFRETRVCRACAEAQAWLSARSVSSRRQFTQAG